MVWRYWGKGTNAEQISSKAPDKGLITLIDHTKQQYVENSHSNEKPDTVLAANNCSVRTTVL